MSQESAVDDSVWDVSVSDVIVDTQDSQGNMVSTRATPLHLKEMLQADKPKPANNVGNTKRGPNQTRPKPSTCKQADSNDIRQFFEGMEDMPSSSAPVLCDPESRKQSNASGSSASSNRDNQPAPKQVLNNRVDTSNPQTTSNSGNRTSSNNASNRRNNNSAKGPQQQLSKPPTKQDTTSAHVSKQSSNNFGATNNIPSTPMSSNTSVNTEKDKYSMVVTRNGWDKSGNANKNKGKKKPMKPIRGLVDSETKEMFVKKN